MAEITKTAPQQSEIEITLFGPGYGESVVIHAEGAWLAVDSCIDPQSQSPAVATYLQSVGVSPRLVHQVIATHWHDDHTRGLAELYRQCENAELVISGALQQREFVGLVEAYRHWPPDSGRITSGVDEFRKTLDEARRRGPSPRFAHQDQVLWRSATGESELWSLSPSNQMLVFALQQIAELLPQQGRAKRRVSGRGPNHAAVALLLRSGNQVALLGSDLENTPHIRTGWAAVIASNTRPQVRGSLFKVAHHGSASGDHPGIWSALLDHQPLAILTPFVRGAVYLPTATDVARLRGQARVVGITSEPRLRAYVRKGALGKLTKPKRLRRLNLEFGVVRCRAQMNATSGSWDIQYGGDARAL